MTESSQKFDYETAFQRNFGWVTAQEQYQLRGKRVAIAGLGGVGGYHLLTLARLGITKFNIAEMDVVELVNFNRQTCAGISSLGQEKIEVMKRMVMDINPDIELRIFSKGITPENIEDFLSDVDLYVDGLDFFVLDLRQLVFRKCAENNIPAMTTAPLGMGVAHLNFLPGKMTFDDYFRLDDVAEVDRPLQFLIGLSPTMLQRGYLKEWSAVSFIEKRGPSTPMSCQLCAGVAGVEALKILLNRPKIISAPCGYQFDAYRMKFKKTWRPFGNRNWLQRLSFKMGQHQLASKIK